MTAHLVTFSDESMSRVRELCAESALAHGVGIANTFRPASVIDFCERPEMVRERGCGYWRWKPRIVLDVMQNSTCHDGDILIYADAGVEFINNISHIIERMDQDIFLFGNNWEHAHWCKRDVVDEVWEIPALDEPYYDYSPRFKGEPKRTEDHYISWENFGKQCQASVIFFRVSDYSRWFVAEWLRWCLFEGGRLIDDSPSRAPNHPEFQENRHDQAILTTLAYREGIKLHYWPASYNDGAFCYEKLPEYSSDSYPVIFSHHRKRNWEFPQAVAV